MEQDSPLVSPQDWMKVAQIVGCHGIQGALKLKTADAQPDWPRQVTSLWLVPSNPVLKKDLPQGGHRAVKQIKGSGDYRCLLQLEGVVSRTEAELWTGTEVWVPLATIPSVGDDDTFRTYELVGLKVISNPEDQPPLNWGTVTAVQYATGQDFLEITLDQTGKTVMIPFQDVFFPKVDIAQGWIEIAGLDDFLQDAAKIDPGAKPTD